MTQNQTTQLCLNVNNDKVTQNEQMQGTYLLSQKTKKNIFVGLTGILLLLYSIHFATKEANFQFKPIDPNFGQNMLVLRNEIYPHHETERNYSNIELTFPNGSVITLPFKQPTIIKFQKSQEKPLEKVTFGKTFYEKILLKYTQFIFQKEKQQNQAFFLLKSLQKQSKIIDYIQYQYYNKKYNLSEEVDEKLFCLISPSRNLFTRGGEKGFRLYAASLERQNYSNFQIFVADDMSQDNSVEKMIQILSGDFPRVRNRISIIRNYDRLGALGNRDLISRNLCPPESIIGQIDADDLFIGRQVLNIMNRMYSKEPNNYWFIYSTFLQIRYSQNLNKRFFQRLFISKFRGIQIDWNDFNSRNYRTMVGQWGTSHFKTYFRSLYIKTPFQYFFVNGTYHTLATDRFNVYSLVQLSSSKRIKYIDQIFYLYRNNVVHGTQKCHYTYSFLKEYQARTQTPLMPLESLDDTARKVENYMIPQKVLTKQKRFQLLYETCLRDRNNKDNNLLS